MDSQDLRSVMTSSEVTPPEEAAQNINRSRLFEISPDSYKEMKSELEPKAVAVERIPATVEPATQDFVKQSKEHFALAQNDLPKLSETEKRLKYYNNKFFEIPEKTRQRNLLSREKLQSVDGTLSPEKEEELQDLNASLAELSSYQPEDIGDFEKWVTDVGSAAGDIVRSYTENIELVGGLTAAGAVTAGGFGAVIGGPFGAVIGAKIGAGTGLATAATVVPLLDAYVQTRDSLYNDLTYGTKEDGSPLNIPHEKRVLVSQGVAAVAGAAAAYAGKVFASNNPFLRKFLDPKAGAKYVLGNPTLMAKLDIIGGIAKSGAAEGFEEGVQQAAEIIGTEFAKMDDSEESFMNAIDTISERITKEVPYAVSVGAGAGSSFATVTNAPAYKAVRSEYENVQRISQKKKEVLETQNMLMEANATLSSTKMQELAPEEARSFKQQLFEKIGFEPNAWFTVEDLKKFANDPEKGKKIRSIIDMNPEMVKLAQETNTPIQISKAEVLDVMTEFPEISDYMRITPEGQNPFEVRNEAKTFAENLSKAEKRRASIMETLGIVEDMESIQANLDEALGPELKESPYFESRDQYAEYTPLKESQILGEKDVNELNKAHLDARMEIDKILVGEVDNKFDRIENTEYRQRTAEEVQEEVIKLEKETAIVNSFQKPSSTPEINSEITSKHKKKGFSAYAIDPKSLPEDLKEIYLNSPELKKRKAFVEGGIDIEEAAVMNGVESGAELLRILAETPTKKQVEQRIKKDPLREFKKREEIREKNEDARLQAIDEKFSTATKLHLKEMDQMKNRSWKTVKRGVIKIAGKVPTIEEINTRASDTVKGMKIRDLNPTQFKVGEARSQKTAVKQFVDGKIEQAFKNKERAAFNIELMKETLKARYKVAKFQKFWKKASDPSTLQSLKDAGYDKVMNEFMSVYKLDGAIPGEAEQKRFNKWVKEQASLGNLIPPIPKRLNNTQASFKDLTLEQYQTITEMGQFIVEQAKKKNKMIENAKARKEFETQEYIAEQIQKITQDHVDYDPTRPKREEKSSKDGDFLLNVHNGVKTLMSSVNNAKNIIMELDNHVVGGFFYQTFIDPLVRAQTGKRQDNFELRKYFKDVIQEFYGGQKNYNKMVNERVEIPEFASFDTLNNGNMRKIDLMRMMAFIGDPDGRKHIENYRDASGASLDFDTVMKVLDRELSEKDAGFVQNFFVAPYKRFEKASAELHKRTTGIDADMVKGVPFIHKGKVYEGGYQPLEYQRLPDEVRAEKELRQMQEEGVLDESGFFARMRAAEMTKQDRLKERSGSQRPIALDFENHFKALEEITHDLHFREAGIDLMKIVKEPHNVQNIKSVIGSKKFVLLLDSIKDVVSKTSDKDQPVFRDQAAILNNILGFGKMLHAVKSISLNVASAAIQWDSLVYMPLRSGPKTYFYMSKTLSKMIANPARYNDLIKLASDILPDIKFEQDAIDDSIVKSSEEFIPYGNVFFKNYKTLGKGVTRLFQLRRKAIDSSFFLLREADRLNKVVATLSLSEQFLNGDIEGYSKDKIDKMSDSEKKETMQKVVKQIVDLSLTASSRLDKTALEKNKVAQLFVNYWTDRRSRLNTIASQVNKSRKSAKTGDYKKAVTQLGFLAVVSGMSVALQNAIRDDEESIFKKMKDIDDPSDAGNFALDTMYDFLTAPATQFAQSVPGVDAMLYMYEGATKYGKNRARPVSVPILGVATDIVLGVATMKETLQSGLDFKRMGKKDRKQLVTLGGYMVGGAPTNTINKVIDTVGDRKVQRNVKEFMEDIMELNGLIKEFSDEHKDDPEAQEFVQDLKEYQKTLPQMESDVSHIIPENAKETLKQALSEGDWTKYDEETGAIGVYQFTAEQWNELTISNPDLGLTENGRLAKDPSQQEKAMEREIQENTKSFMVYDIPVTESNLLGAHKFGFDNFASIHGAEDSKKLSEVLGEEASNPVFKNFETVKQVKTYLSRAVQKGK